MQKSIKIIANTAILVIFAFTNLSLAKDMNNINLTKMDFDYKIQKQGLFANNNWKPLDVFTNGAKTYIKFGPEINSQNLPDLYLISTNPNVIPQWKWEKPYMVIDQPLLKAKIANPKTGDIAYTIQYKKDYIPYIKPSPKVTTKIASGFFVSLNAGAGAVDSTSLHSFIGGFGMGYDSSITRHFNIGGELGFNYNGKSKSTSSKGAIKSWDYELMGRINYLFFNGINIFGKAGLAYTINTWQNKDTNSGLKKSKVLPKFVIGSSYQFTNGIGLGLQLSHNFGSGDVASNTGLTLLTSYYF